MAGINLMDRHMAIAASPHIENQNGSITFTKKALAMPVKKMLVDIEPFQSGSGDPSPDNVRPISGWDSVTVNRTGKNLLKITMQSSTGRQGVDTTVNDDGTVIINGTTTAFAGRALGTVSLKKGVTYYLSGAPNLGSLYATYLYRSGVGTLARETGAGASYTPSEDMTVSFYLSVNGGTTANNVVFKPMLSTSSDTAFSAYQGNTYTIQLGETVYGGTLDVTTGLLTVTMAEVDLGTLNWRRNGQKLQFYSVSIIVNAVSDRLGKNVICSSYTGGNAYAVSGNYLICINESNPRVFVTDDRFTDDASLKAAMSGVRLVYELATPQTYQLTPTQIALLAGENNVWADTGNVTAKFWSH